MAYEQIRYEVADRIATITLDRPDNLNAFTGRMMWEMVSAFDEVDADDDVRAVIVTGAGRAFCAGADLSAGSGTFDATGRGGEVGAGVTEADASESANPIPRDGGGLVTLRMFDCLKPVIGAINGNAVGVGMTMQLPMDVRLVSTAASKLGFVFGRRGITPEACSSWFLPRIVGISQAMEWVASGRLFDAAEGVATGLYRSAHEPDDLLPAARALATSMTESTAPVSVALSRQLLWRMLGASHPMEAHRADSRGIFFRGQSADTREGVASFLEKRTPDFPDKVSSDLPDLFPDRPTPAY
jgi:enoyl-CoA hydratase/carnithine racemase